MRIDSKMQLSSDPIIFDVFSGNPRQLELFKVTRKNVRQSNNTSKTKLKLESTQLKWKDKRFAQMAPTDICKLTENARKTQKLAKFRCHVTPFNIECDN